MSKLSSATGFTLIFLTFDGGGFARCDGMVIAYLAVFWISKNYNNRITCQVLICSIINYSHVLHATEVLRRQRAGAGCSR